MLSPHFSVEELTTTQHRELDNTPGEQELANLTTLANETLEAVREYLGPMHVNSGYRSPEVNEAIGGSKTSQHMEGLACDFVPMSSMTLKEALAEILARKIIFDQMIYEFGRWLHISHAAPEKQPRMQVLMIGSWTGGKYQTYNANDIP